MSMEVAQNVPYWDPGEVISSIRVDPTDTRCIYFTVGHSIFYSRDRGKSWMTKGLHASLRYLYTVQASVYIFSADSIYSLDKNSGKITASPLPFVMQPVVRFAAGRIKPTGAT